MNLKDARDFYYYFSETMVEVTLLDPSNAKNYRSLLLEAYASSPEAFTSTSDERALEPESWWVKRLVCIWGNHW